MTPEEKGIFSNLKYDVPAAIVVFLVALPLCLGIAVASEAPPLAGLIAGICGGIIVGFFSRSSLAVSGPAAGLITIVLGALSTLGSFETFLVALVLAGLMQMAFGFLKLGVIGNFFPLSVIRGMLSAIGITLILKQIPHAVGWDKDPEGQMGFVQPDGENTFSELANALQHISPGAAIICLISLVLLIVWELPALKKFKFFKLVPAPLLVVILGISLNSFFASSQPDWALSNEEGNSHLVNIPIPEDLSADGLKDFFQFPDFNAAFSGEVATIDEAGDPITKEISFLSIIVVAFTIALVASLETLLSIEATDKMDPFKRSTPLDRELKAQGLGNTLSGLIGGLPITAVIVRSTANINSGGRTRVSAVLHGILLLSAVAFFPAVFNLIPLASLAAILLMIGYKLAKPSLFKQLYNKGLDQFIPFIITIIAILLTDLLVGIGIGMVVGFIFVLRNNFHTATQLIHEKDHYLYRFEKDVSFLNKANIRKTLDSIPSGSTLIIDASKSEFIDQDVIEMIEDYVNNAKHNDINVKLVGVDSKAPPEIKISKARSVQMAPERKALVDEES